ncbi:hypothetical protein N7499_001978 [Penicillium canescens]|nr:hypothetical protein N7499_001978 [Penicillium canescens]KAJ6165592.1 hypothetical protein N7485_008836 [Penicillium canescens]
MTGAPQLYNPEDDHAKLQRNAALTHLEKNKPVSSFTRDEDSQTIQYLVSLQEYRFDPGNLASQESLFSFALIRIAAAVF